MQALYQFDARINDQNPDDSEIALSVQDSPLDDEAKELAMQFARQAWAAHGQADELINSLSDNWPTHRQPVVDRSILRLAFYEIASGLTPPRVVMNESIELAKSFGGEKSPAFINGVVDKMSKRITRDGISIATDKPAVNSDEWLADALKEETEGDATNIS